jgi:hypothetical protein
MAEKLKNAPSKGEGGSWLYGILLMAAGGFVIVLGILDLLNMNFIYNYLVGTGNPDLAAMLPTVGITNFIIGIFAIIGGYGLIIDQEWGWGISMLILVYTAAQAAIYLVNSAIELSISPSSLNALAVAIVSGITIVVAAVGMIYLGLTKYKYA